MRRKKTGRGGKGLIVEGVVEEEVRMRACEKAGIFRTR